MKKRLIAILLASPLILTACGKTDTATLSGNSVSEASVDVPVDAPVAPTATPTPTPIPLPENNITAPEEWHPLQPEEDGWITADWLTDHTDIMEWDSGQDGTIISSITKSEPKDAANQIITSYENAIAANVYATAGDCTVEVAFFGNALGFFIAPKWSEETYCCFIVGNISSGIGWEMTTKALSNYEKFAMYDYNLSKLFDTRINIEGDIRAIDDGYWEQMEDRANELSGWSAEENEGYRKNVQGIYKLFSSLYTAVDVTEQRLGQSETVYTSEDGIRVCDIHLPDGYDSLKPHNNISDKERYVSVINKESSLVVNGQVPQEYEEYLYDLIWNEREIHFWSDEEEPAPSEEEENSSDENTKETDVSTKETDENEESSPIRLLDYFDCGEGRVYMFAEVPDDTPADAKYSETTLSGYTFVYYREDGIGCSVYVSAKLYDTKKKALDLARQLFL